MISSLLHKVIFLTFNPNSNYTIVIKNGRSDKNILKINRIMVKQFLIPPLNESFSPI
jgi:hypothetical protein